MGKLCANQRSHKLYIAGKGLDIYGPLTQCQEYQQIEDYIKRKCTTINHIKTFHQEEMVKITWVHGNGSMTLEKCTLQLESLNCQSRPPCFFAHFSLLEHCQPRCHLRFALKWTLVLWDSCYGQLEKTEFYWVSIFTFSVSNIGILFFWGGGTV